MIVGSTKWRFSCIAGVIDLAGGKAVHAVAGERAGYKPVASCGGDPLALVQQYRQLGIGSFYIADLDAICGQPLQATLLDEMATEMEGEVLVDPGWSGTESESVVQAISRLVESHPYLGVIAATETADSPAALNRLVEYIAVTRIWLGLDFRKGALMVSPSLQEHTLDLHAQSADAFDHAATERGNDVTGWHGDYCANPTLWVEHASLLGIRRMLVLDIATVGKRGGAVTGEVCCDIKQTNPDFRIWSGGGIRNAADADQLIQQGCDRCLVATALQGLL